MPAAGMRGVLLRPLVNRDEERLARNPAYQARIGAAIVDAAVNHCRSDAIASLQRKD